ncbi:laminin subunit alpha-1 [Eucyclogobius newberryi]|uniref:laminin subunit alpha-1 n=1 Tax=Eucyclogobius newberryi TaxID=166745 RepID=UPI003B5A2E07
MRLLLPLVLLVLEAQAQNRGLFPAILNLASKAEIHANATCGNPQPEVYCKLVEHVPGKRIKNPHCPRCDSRSASHHERHPIKNAIDGTNEWWQSPSIKNGRQFHWVTITLDLKQIFQVAYIIIKAANSPRPGNWILERSLDGVSFEPWQFYAISDSECLTRYNITPRLGPPTYKSDTEVICTSYYSRLEPLEDGEIHTSLLNGRPGSDDLTSALLDFTSARYIRLRLQRIRTLNADLMTLSTHDPRDIDPIVTRRYFYSIKDISIGGMCICYGHAQSCPLNLVTQKLHCVCEHNTCGENCNECCRGYHQLPWQPGTITAGNTCEKCNCHNKADDCFYNQTVSDLRLSLNTAGLWQGGGVCVHCQQNTAGVNCETCADGFYRPQGVSPYSDSPCVPCGCDLRGSHSSVCVRDDASPGASSGQCPCRQGFAGHRCDRCAFGYRDFPLCSKCECNLAGSTNTDPCEECVCKKNVMGFHCDLCKPGFYHLQPENPHGCTDCFCFGVSNVCESSPWSTNQVTFSNAWLQPVDQLHPLTVVHDNNFLLPINRSRGHAHQYEMSWDAPRSFLTNKLTSFRRTLNYTLFYDVPLDNLDRSLPAHSDVIIQGSGRSLRLSRPHLLSLSPLSERTVAVVIGPHQFVDDVRGHHVTRDELLTVLSDVTTLRVRVLLNTSAAGPIRLGLVSLEMADPTSVSGNKAVAVETCECPYGYSGTSCESCLPGFYRVGGVLFGGNCLQCDCHDHSSVCDVHGLCLSCSHNTTGPHCEHCLPGFYGDATEGTEQDCKKCPCPLTAASNSFSPTCLLQANGVTCDRCEPGYTGNNCERCANGFYGNPQVLGGSCSRCECNGNVNWEEAGHCDHVTGECLLCSRNTAGRHCEHCRGGYYGDALHAKNCTECGCDPSGALTPVCRVSSGHCECKANVEGRACDRCMPGFYGIESGQGCVPCSCSQSGSVSESCDSGGRCRCVEGVAGDKCDQCARGHYNYRDGRCTECNCAHTGGNCNSETGQCICPPHTQGAKCEECTPDHWGHDAVTGCQPCSCSSSGSFTSQCDQTGGQCRCRPGFGGSSCDRCAPGYHGYPACNPCGCDPAGTEEEFCNGTICDCLQDGQCVCKSGVSGRRCEECVSGRFALSSLNPEGCSQCYCSGLSQDCEEQGGFTATQVSVSSPSVLPVVSQSNLKGVVSGVFVQDGDVLLDVRHLDTSGLFGPLYWKLPNVFTGNKLMSYGGTLSYSALFYAEDGQGLTNQEPQVLMRGGTLRKLVIYTDMPAPSNGVRTRHDIRLTEHGWRYFNSVSEKAVSRSDFMMVLSNVLYVTVKASYGSRLQQSRISNITMETAVEEGAEITGGVARQIESCDCPWGYSGLSCQDCAPGFFRQPLSEISPRSQRSVFVRPCVPCRCNSHSQKCEQETGACQGCDHHTSGPNCELCATGYYGNVRGSLSDCSLCDCPLRGNSFSPTCELTAASFGYVCTNCSSGYEGQHCERCSDGYYGNPTVMGGACEQCGCSDWGALGSSCNKTSGQCECKTGVRGQHCDQCQERYVMEAGHCISCNDQCTGVLLDDLDTLHSHISSVNVSGLLRAPYSQLVALENRTRTITKTFFNSSSASALLLAVEDQLTSVASELAVVSQKVSEVTGLLEHVSGATDHSVSQSALLLENVHKLNKRVTELIQEAELLNQTNPETPEWTNHTQMLLEAESLVDSMRIIDLSNANATVTQELSLSESVSSSVGDFLSSADGVDRQHHNLSSEISAHTDVLKSAEMHLKDAEEQNAMAHKLMDTASGKLHQYESLSEKANSATSSVNDLMEDSQLMLSDTLSLTEDLTNSTEEVELMGEQLSQWRSMLRKQVDALVMGLKRTDALELVYRAESHAQSIHSHALSIQSSLSAVCNFSQNGTRLFRLDMGVTEQVNSAHQEALDAQSSASTAVNTSGVSSLSQEGGVILNDSSSVLEESQRANHSATERGAPRARVLNKSSTKLYKPVKKSTTLAGVVTLAFTKVYKGANFFLDLQKDVSSITSRIAAVKQNFLNTSSMLSRPIRELQSISNGSSIALATQLHTEGHSSLQGALKRLQEIQEQLLLSSSVVDNANNSVKQTNELMSHTDKTANEAQRQLQEAELRSERLMERVKPLSILGENLSRNLSEIRELIEQARRQAASIKVAVQAERSCVRSYRPQISSSNFNTLTLTLKTSTKNNLLFYLGSTSLVDFIALEEHAGKVSLLWDVGSGNKRLEFPGLDISNNKWTRINVTRFGSHASLSVYQLDSDSAPPLPMVTATSPGTARVLDIDNTTKVYVGGANQNMWNPLFKSHLFQGCLGEASLNEKNLGLWNYETRQGQCGGCFSSPQMEETAFHFDGSGYTVVQKSLRATSTSIVLLFKTLSPGGLLLYLASNNTRDFLSMELVEGHVRLTFDLGSGVLVLMSQKKYNTGMWYKITLQRNKRKGYLSIMAADQSSEKEVLEAESPGTASDLNRNDLDPIYIGGLPASRPIRRQVVSRSYMGCIKNVEIARTNFDLLRDAFGVRKGCTLEAVRSMSLFGPGFVELAPRSFTQETDILMTFSSRNQSGLLLSALSHDKQHFMSMQLMSGTLEAELGKAGGASQRAIIVGEFSDGQHHSVIINLSKKVLSIHVDELPVKSIHLSPGAVSSLSPSSVFIGGLPSGAESRLPTRIQSLSRSFRGCIQNLALNGMLVDLSGAAHYEGAELDSCLLEKRAGGAVLNGDQDLEPTADPAHLPVVAPTYLSALTPGALTCAAEVEPSFLSSGAQFGSSKHSHMTFNINPSAVKKSLSMRISFRTWALDGLLLLMSSKNQMDFAVLRLVGGHLELSADLGKGPASVTSSRLVNDGNWHTVTAEVSRRSVSISVGGTSDSTHIKGNQLDVESRVYVGGLPHTHTAKRINVSNSFPGCIRSVALNNAALDLNRPETQHNVAACFSSDQKGAHFNGSGHAVFMHNGYKVGSDLTLSLEFMTSQSDAVLLGISSAKVDAIGLELVSGQVVFHVNNGAGRVSVRSSGPFLCDGRWHSVTAKKTKHAMSLSVDRKHYRTPNPYPQSTSAETNNPVYVGGFPADVKQNCLSVSAPFRGCLKNLQLAKSHHHHLLDFSSAHVLRGVLSSSCPASNRQSQ